MPMLHHPDQANGDAIILTHGASSNCDAPLLVQLAGAFADAGFITLRYDLPFRTDRPRGSPSPSGAARDRDGVRQAAGQMRLLAPGRIFAGGHSYGGRQTAMAASETPGFANALLLLSYPLHPPNQPEKKRTDYFPRLQTSALFVHGTRDPFGSIKELREAMALIPARTDLLVVEGAAHDLKRAAGMAVEILERLRALV